MNPRQTQEQIGLFPATRTPGTVGMDTLLVEAYQARDAAIGGALRRGFQTAARALGAVATALVSWPQRRAAYEQLKSLSDRELADIGLTRSEISRVFDPDFSLPTRPANANAPVAKPQAA